MPVVYSYVRVCGLCPVPGYIDTEPVSDEKVQSVNVINNKSLQTKISDVVEVEESVLFD